MYEHLLVPVDGSDLTDRAMESSIALARKLGARITEVYLTIRLGGRRFGPWLLRDHRLPADARV